VAHELVAKRNGGFNTSSRFSTMAFSVDAPGLTLLPHGIGFMQKSECARRGDLAQIAAVRQPTQKLCLPISG